ncbi:LOB domain-containing protein 23-like [Tasmannia lanceolata]|uniref:LOB domain-containing protein 23-like n=1 Tax=Tasmannia lanceolata TaxID=3420 RepID=UPI00406429D3
MNTRPRVATRCHSTMNVPCAGCKLLRKRCTKDCIFVPYFPSTEPGKFASVHRIFGSSNLSKLLRDIPDIHRGDAVTSMVYEANARLEDPVYGCVSSIVALQNQVSQLQSELANTLAETITLRAQLAEVLSAFTRVNDPTMDRVEDNQCLISSLLGQDYSQDSMFAFPQFLK